MMRRFRKRAEERRTDEYEVGLADVCEAVLHGRYVEHLQRCHQPVPGWAWLNRLAHGTREELGGLAGADHVHTGSTPAPAWRAAQSFLATVVLDRAAEGAGGLTELQCRVLVPLELALITSPGAASTPPQLVNRVLAILEDHRSRNPRG